MSLRARAYCLRNSLLFPADELLLVAISYQLSVVPIRLYNCLRRPWTTCQNWKTLRRRSKRSRLPPKNPSQTQMIRPTIQCPTLDTSKTRNNESKCCRKSKKRYRKWSRRSRPSSSHSVASKKVSLELHQSQSRRLPRRSR